MHTTEADFSWLRHIPKLNPIILLYLLSRCACNGDCAAPEITEGPVDVTEFVDNRLMMSCAARGDPRPTIQWQKRNGTGGRWMQVSRASERYKVQRSGNLVIRRLLASDAGLFRCVAENTVGSSYSTEATLVVQGKLVAGTVVHGTTSVIDRRTFPALRSTCS